MQIAILIEPLDAGGFRASSGEPIVASAEGSSEDDATQNLREKLQERLGSGAHLSTLDLGSGSCQSRKLKFEPLPDDDWFFKTMRDAIAENRSKEDRGS